MSYSENHSFWVNLFIRLEPAWLVMLGALLGFFLTELKRILDQKRQFRNEKEWVYRYASRVLNEHSIKNFEAGIKTGHRMAERLETPSLRVELDEFMELLDVPGALVQINGEQQIKNNLRNFVKTKKWNVTDVGSSS